MPEIDQALDAELVIVNGLHQPLSEIKSISQKAKELGIEIMNFEEFKQKMLV